MDVVLRVNVTLTKGYRVFDRRVDWPLGEVPGVGEGVFLGPRLPIRSVKSRIFAPLGSDVHEGAHVLLTFQVDASEAPDSTWPAGLERNGYTDVTPGRGGSQG